MNSMESPVANDSGRERAGSTLTGLRISPGLAMGKAWIAADVLKAGADVKRIQPDEIPRELSRIQAAFDDTRTATSHSIRR
jgi:hypothetical protein